MKRILCIVGSMDTGGAETFLMKIYRVLDREKYQIDFCVGTQKEGFYNKEILGKGGRVFPVCNKTTNLFRYIKELRCLIKSEQYCSVLRVGADCFAGLDLWVALSCGMEKRAFRSSNSGSDSGKVGNLLHIMLRKVIFSVSNIKIAPSKLAAEYTFGKRALEKGNVTILPNAIPIEKFVFHKETRERLRKKLQIDNKIVIGHVARLTKQKNQKFLLQILAEIVKKEQNVKLLIIGDGELKQELIEKARELGLGQYIDWMGIRDNINELMLCFDVFVLTSFYEGMPNVVVEAQASGLSCILSDTITKEVNITGNVKFLPIRENYQEWGEIILKKAMVRDNDAANKMKKKHYAIEESADKFVELLYT